MPSNSMRPYGTMLPLPCDVNAGLMQPPQITAGGASSFRERRPAPAASSALCCAHTGNTVVSIMMATAPNTYLFPTCLLIVYPPGSKLFTARPEGTHVPKKNALPVPVFGPKGRHCPYEIFPVKGEPH